MKDWLIFVLLFILVMNQFNFLGCNESVTTVDKEVTIDTIYKVIEKVIIKEPIITKETKTVSVPVNNIQELPTELKELIAKVDSFKIDLPINRYKDSIDIDGAILHYNHLVSGTLEDSKYSLKVPLKTEVITKKETILKNRLLDLYIVGGFQFAPTDTPNNRLSGGLDLVFKDFKVGYRVDASDFGGVSQLNNRIEFGYKIFGL